AARDPADEGVDEMDRAERGAGTGGLAVPPLAAVDGMPDSALVADSPSFLGADELHPVEGRVLVEADLAGTCAGSEQGDAGEGQEIGSHVRSPVRVAGRAGQEPAEFGQGVSRSPRVGQEEAAAW